jgi:hypothetical protein
MLTIGRILIVHQSGTEIPAIVTEVNGTSCCVTGFPPRRSPVTILDMPWFRARHEALEWLGAQSAQNTHVGYLPYKGDEALPVDAIVQVASALADNDADLRALVERAGAGHDLQDPEIGRTLPPIRGVLTVPLDPLIFGTRP